MITDVSATFFGAIIMATTTVNRVHLGITFLTDMITDVSATIQLRSSVQYGYNN